MRASKRRWKAFGAVAALVASSAAACDDASIDLLPVAVVFDGDAGGPGADAAPESDGPAYDAPDGDDDATGTSDGAADAADDDDAAPPLCGGVTCVAPKPACDVAQGVCVECMTSLDCAVGHCEPTHRCEL